MGTGTVVADMKIPAFRQLTPGGVKAETYFVRV